MNTDEAKPVKSNKSAKRGKGERSQRAQVDPRPPACRTLGPELLFLHFALSHRDPRGERGGPGSCGPDLSLPGSRSQPSVHDAAEQAPPRPPCFQVAPGLGVLPPQLEQAPHPPPIHREGRCPNPCFGRPGQPSLTRSSGSIPRPCPDPTEPSLAASCHHFSTHMVPIATGGRRSPDLPPTVQPQGLAVDAVSRQPWDRGARSLRPLLPAVVLVAEVPLPLVPRVLLPDHIALPLRAHRRAQADGGAGADPSHSPSAPRFSVWKTFCRGGM